MDAYYIPAERDIIEPHVSGSLTRILNYVEQENPGIEFKQISPDSDAELRGERFYADLPNGARIIICDESYRA